MKRRNQTKIDSIYRLAYALERDINKITGNCALTIDFNKSLDQSFKLDIISDKLLELRDKLEKNFNNDQQNFSQLNNYTNYVPNYNYNNSNVTPNYNVIQTPQLNSYTYQNMNTIPNNSYGYNFSQYKQF